MASSADQDGLVLLRQSISSSQPFHPVPSATSSAAETPLSQATHLAFPSQSIAVPLDIPTRFVSNDKPVDLRSIYFAWLNREVAIPEYNASATKLNDELDAAGTKGKVQNLGFIERLDLITWLEGASEESEYIKPAAGDKDGAAPGVATAAKTGAAASAAQARSGKGTMDPRLASIYNAERRMGDRNTALRGIKPTVCLRLRVHVRVELKLTSSTGLHICAKAGRALYPEELQVRLQQPQERLHRHQPESALSEARPDYPPFAVCFFSPSPLQRAILPRGWQVYTCCCRRLNRNHAPRPAHHSIYRPEPPYALHPG